MAWTSPRTWVAGELVTAALMNTHVRDNLSALRSGGIAIGSQGANEIIFASSSTQLSRSSSFTYDGTAFLCATGSITAAASEANNTVGAGVTAVLRVVNTNTGAAGRLAELQFGITATGKYAAISGSLTDASSNTLGGIKISTRQAAGDANLTQRGQITAAGIWSWETAGTHVFTGASSTANRLDVINTTSGTGANAQARVAAGTTSAIIQALSQGYTTGTIDVQAGVVVQSTGAGGMSIVTSDSSGVIRFYPAGTTERARFATSGNLLLGTTTDIAGLNPIVYGSPQIGLGTSGVAHGMTTIVATDVLGILGYVSATDGGVQLWGFTETVTAVKVSAYNTNDDTGKATTALGCAVIDGAKKSGSSVAAIGANANILAVSNAGTTRFILDGDGDSHQDVGTAWTNFDDFDDVALLTALSVGVSREGDPVREFFGELLDAHRPDLERARVVTFNEDGHHFVNMSRLQMLTVGAVRQLARALAETRAELKRLREDS